MLQLMVQQTQQHNGHNITATAIRYTPGCGTGHLQTTKLTYNKDADEWGTMCWNDGAYGDFAGWGVFMGTLPQPKGVKHAQAYVNVPPTSSSEYSGGGLSVISRGASGYLSVGIGQ